MGISELIALLCGVALFLFGMTLMGEGLKKVSGQRLGPVLFRLSGTPVKGILLGAGVTAVIQSSSATSVMVVGFVNSGMMKVRQAISVILGAILGTSITGWIICLSYLQDAGGWASLLSTATLTGVIAILGIILRLFCKRQDQHHLGDILMGFAVLMVGMSQMSGAVNGLGREAWFTGLLSGMSHPLLGIGVGILFSAVLQSASAAVGIVQALSVTGAVRMEAALPLLMGITIGASLPVLLSALGANTDGKRTAVSYLIASFMGVMVCASLFYIADTLFHFSFLSMVMDPFSLAWVNTLLRLAILCVLAPFTDVLEAVASLFVPDKAIGNTPEIRLENRFIAHPSLAIEQSRLTIGDMAQHTEEAIQKSLGLLRQFSAADYERVQALEEEGDRYEDALGSYLVKLTGQELTEQQSHLASLFLHTISDFERISDHALSIARSANEMREKQIDFSEDAMHEVSVLSRATREMIRITVSAFTGDRADLAGNVEPLEEVIDQLCDEMKLHHVKRLQEGLCTIEHGFVLNDLMINFQRVSAHCSNIAVAIIELNSGSFDTHEYLGTIKNLHAAEYEQLLQEYNEEYHF